MKPAETGASTALAIPCPGCGKSLRLPPLVDQPTGLCPYCGCEMELGRWQSGDAATPGESSAGSLVGRRLGGYRLLRIIGRGGMSHVYLGQDEATHRQVAVKVLRGDLAHRARAVERFERESEALARLDHPNIVSLIDRGREDGYYYLVMERVGAGSGQPTSIRSLIRRRALTIPQSIRIVQKILSALSAAHARGIVHRDIKPTNVLVDDDGEVKVTDFGIARVFRAGDASGPDRTEPAGEQVVLGSVAYMSPEQKRGHPAVDHRADIYSVGILFYEMIVGRRPALKYVPPSEILPGLGAFLDGVIARAIEESPARRYSSGEEMLAAIEGALDKPGGDTVTSTRVAVAELEWGEESEPEPARGEYTCPICGKTGPSDRERCFYCGLSKRRRCVACGGEAELSATACPRCKARLPDLKGLVGLLRGAEASFESFRRNPRRSAKRIDEAKRLLERYTRALKLGADKRDVQARVLEVKGELVRMLTASARQHIARERADLARVELEQVLSLADSPEARKLLDEIEATRSEGLPPAREEEALKIHVEEEAGDRRLETGGREEETPSPLRPPVSNLELASDPLPPDAPVEVAGKGEEAASREGVRETDAAPLRPDSGAENVGVEAEATPAVPPCPAAGATPVLVASQEPWPAPEPPIPLAARPHSGHHARPAGRRGFLAPAIFLVLIAAGAVGIWKGLPGLGNLAGQRQRQVPPARPKTWAEAEVHSAGLAEAGQPFEAARVLHEARGLPGGKAGAEEAARIEALVAASVEAAAARGEDGRACEELAWWTAQYPDSSPERVRALEVLILSSSIDRAVQAGDFAAAAAALRHLVSLAPEEGGDSRSSWAGFLSAGLEDRALAGECRAAFDALEVLSLWGSPSGEERRRRMAEFLAPFCAEGSDLSVAYRPFWTEDMALGLPVLRAFEIRRDADGRVYRFVLARGAPGEQTEAPHFQIALFPRDVQASRTTAAEAEIHRNRLLAGTKNLREIGHHPIELAGIECETYTFVRPAEPGGSDTFVEFYLFQKGPTVTVLTLALDAARLAVLRPLLLVSISHLKAY